MLITYSRSVLFGLAGVSGLRVFISCYNTNEEP